MPDYDDEVQDLIWEAESRPYGDLKTELLRRAADIAEQHQDTALAYAARHALIGATLYNGRLDEMFVHLAWCRGICERQPDQFPVADIIWQHKWAAENVHDFSSISLVHVEAVLSDFRSLLEAHGYNLRPWYKIRYSLARHLDDADAVHAYFQLWRDTPRDDQSDCVACDLDTEANYHYLRQDYDAGLRTLAPVFAKQDTCIHEPENSWAMSLEPLALQGAWERATAFTRSASRSVRGQSGFTFARYHLVRYLSASGQGQDALQLWIPYTRDVMHMTDTLTRADFALVSSELFRRMHATGTQTVALHLSPELPYARPDGAYATADLAAYFAAERDRHAAAFDARNGSDAYSRYLAREIAGMDAIAAARAAAGRA